MKRNLQWILCLGLSIVLGLCFAVSCVELSDDDLALDYENLQPEVTDVLIMAVGDEFPVYEPQYVEPLGSPMAIELGEIIREIYYSGDSLSELQAMIDTDRNSSAGSDLLYVHVSGRLTVTNTPLKLTTKTVLIFEGDQAGVIAADDASATSLVYVNANSANVGIMYRGDNSAHTVLDGNMRPDMCGVYSTNSSRVHIDKLSIANCVYGIYYDGTGTGLVNVPGVITRCIVTVDETLPGGGSYGRGGIWVVDASQPVITNNEVTVSGTPYDGYRGIYSSSSSSTIHMNKCVNCDTGIQLDPKSTQNPYCVITRNQIYDGLDCGIKLSGNSKGLVITENDIASNDVGIKVNGTSNHIFNNKFSNTQNIKGESGSYNLIARNDDITYAEIEAGGTGLVYFNPPSASNPHTDGVYLGKTRVDITIDSTGDEPMDMEEVQDVLDEFDTVTNSGNNKYLVLTLNGEFIANGIADRASPYTGGYAGFIVPGYTTVILNGTITANGENMYMFQSDSHYGKGSGASSGDDVGYGGTSIALFSSTEPGSMSGGVLDCWGYRYGAYHSLPAFAAYAPKNNLLILDGVTLKGASQNQLGLLHHSGINTPVFVYDCDFDGCVTSNSCIWSHMCSYNYHIGCRGYNTELGNFSGFDAGGSDSYSIFNYTCDVGRCGVVMEEGASRNYIMGNYFNGSNSIGNGRYGVGMYNSGGEIEQKNNMILMNKTEGTLAGIKIQHSKDQFMFNNVTLSGEFHIATNCETVYSSCDIFDNSNYTWGQPAAGGDISNTFFTLPYL